MEFLLEDEMVRRYLENCTSNLCEDDTSTDDTSMIINFKSSRFLYLFILLMITIMVSLFKLYFFDIPREKRNTRARENGRKDLIESRIIRKTVLTKSMGQSDHDSKPYVQHNKSDVWLSFTEDDVDKDETGTIECPVCWEAYKENEKICWSQNPQCIHTFHIECIEAWLMKHDECPLCRNDYLALPPEVINSEENPVSEADHHSRGTEEGLPMTATELECTHADKNREMCRRGDGEEADNPNSIVADSTAGAMFDSECGTEQALQPSSHNDIESGLLMLEELKELPALSIDDCYSEDEEVQKNTE